MAEKTINVDEELYDVLASRADEKGFDSTDEYVHYVLNQVADKIRRKQGGNREKEGFSEEDEEKVKERLRGLGYLD